MKGVDVKGVDVKGAVLEARGLTRRFPAGRVPGWRGRRRYLTAVDGVDLSVRAGETLGLVGESGCGKTTLTRALLMLDTPSGGEVRFNGKRLEDLDARERGAYRCAVQPVFQNPFSSLNPRMRVRRIVAEPLQIGSRKTRREIDAAVDASLERVGLAADDARKFPHEFSGGQRQRIAIARALASEPEILILDEAVSSQDISIRAQILNLLKDLQETLNLGYLFVAHDLATVRFMSDRVAVMHRGRIVESAASECLYDRPRHPYTRALLDACLPADVRR